MAKETATQEINQVVEAAKVKRTIEVPESTLKLIREKYSNRIDKGELKRILIPKDDLEMEELEVIVTVPDRDTVSQFMRFIDKSPRKAQELLVNQCLLTSKEEVLADDNLFFTCAGAIAELFPIRQGRIKNF